MSCPICDIKKELVVYEDDTIVAYVAPTPAAEGHVIVTTKEHYPIIEMIPDPVLSKLFTVTNHISSTIFEKVNAEGTNILVQNGVAAGQTFPHAVVHIIPRKKNDGLTFTWPTKQLSDDEMSTIELKLKELTQHIGVFEKEQEKPVEVKEPEEISPEENYLIKQLQRLP